MDVIKRVMRVVAISPFCAVLIVCYQNCAVELSENTFGAASSCEPSAQELTDFAAVLSAFLQATGTLSGGGQACGTCHLTNSGNTASARFSVLPGTDAASTKANWCSAQSQAARLSGTFLTTTHPGGTYSQSAVQPLIDWATQVR